MSRILGPQLSRRSFLVGPAALAVATALASVACAKPLAVLTPAASPIPPPATPPSAPAAARVAPTPTTAATAVAAARVAATATLAPVPVPPRPALQQLRAYWVDAFHPGSKSQPQVDFLLNEVRNSGANAIIVQVRRRADAYFNRAIEPRTDDPDLAPGFDALQYLLDAARSFDPPIQVHAWVASLPIWHHGWPAPTSPAHVFNQHGPTATGRDNWLSWDQTGKQDDNENFALDPGHPDAADYTVRVISDLARNYDVDGIHLDYIRYSFKNWGYNPVNVARFNRRHDRAGQPAVDDPRWTDWRREQVTALVRRIYLSVQAIRPSIQLSAALIDWGNGPTDDASYLLSAPYARTFQDWRAWLAEGILDLGVLMAYFKTDDPTIPHGFDNWTAFALANQGKRRVVVGPGIFLNPPAESIAQIKQALALGAPGIALYSFASFARSEWTPRSQLRDLLVGTGPNDPKAPFATPAVPAPLPWKQAATEAHLAGRLLAADGTPIDGGAVTLSGPVKRNLTTDGSGTFGAIALPPGSYRVEPQSGRLARPVTTEVVAGRVATVELRSNA